MYNTHRNKSSVNCEQPVKIKNKTEWNAGRKIKNYLKSEVNIKVRMENKGKLKKRRERERDNVRNFLYL